MSSFELWFSDSESDDNYDDLSIKRRIVRDSSNPLELPNEMFIKFFRISKEIFKFLLEKVEAKLSLPVGSSSVSPIIKLAACVRFLAEGNYQKGIENNFFIGLAQSTTSKAVTSVIDIIESDICPLSIKFPIEEEEKNTIKLGFFERTGFPGVVGSVDGSHVKIISPSGDTKHLYYNRKGYYSLNVMLVCDHNMVIRYVDANFPGSWHDSFIWNTSSLDQHMATNYENGDRNSWLLGDAGYPLKPYLITPFRSSSSERNSNVRARFNTKHSKTRIIIERTIGALKNSFRCTLGAQELHYKPNKATKIINVCCALHNLRIKYNMDMEEQDCQEDETDYHLGMPQINQEDDADAIRIRQEIINSLF